MASPLRMIAAAHYIPLPKETSTHPLGDDAYFICQEKQVVGVADGVGGWARQGIDAGEYARQLIGFAEIAVLGEDDAPDPLAVLGAAYAMTEVKGSSTACIVALKDRHIHTANVGDSGFVVIRNGEAIYRSAIQQKSFNHPFQLGNDSTSDTPFSADVTKFLVEPRDVVVVGTDGLFDNLGDVLIANMVDIGMELALDPQDLAINIALSAKNVSENRYMMSPYAAASKKAGMLRIGGKPDDITVVLMYIVGEELPNQPLQLVPDQDLNLGEVINEPTTDKTLDQGEVNNEQG